MVVQRDWTKVRARRQGFVTVSRDVWSCSKVLRSVCADGCMFPNGPGDLWVALHSPPRGEG